MASLESLANHRPPPRKAAVRSNYFAGLVAQSRIDGIGKPLPHLTVGVVNRVDRQDQVSNLTCGQRLLGGPENIKRRLRDATQGHGSLRDMGPPRLHTIRGPSRIEFLQNLLGALQKPLEALSASGQRR